MPLVRPAQLAQSRQARTAFTDEFTTRSSMANREELGIIRGARAGNAAAQLELGKRYLFGGTGLPKSLPTALHWLDRAAQQDCAEACRPDRRAHPACAGQPEPASAGALVRTRA